MLNDSDNEEHQNWVKLNNAAAPEMPNIKQEEDQEENLINS